jgi:hypothetical protein
MYTKHRRQESAVFFCHGSSKRTVTLASFLVKIVRLGILEKITGKKKNRSGGIFSRFASWFHGSEDGKIIYYDKSGINELFFLPAPGIKKLTF